MIEKYFSPETCLRPARDLLDIVYEMLLINSRLLIFIIYTLKKLAGVRISTLTKARVLGLRHGILVRRALFQLSLCRLQGLLFENLQIEMTLVEIYLIEELFIEILLIEIPLVSMLLIEMLLIKMLLISIAIIEMLLIRKLHLKTC